MCLADSKMTGFLFVLSSLPLHQLTQDGHDDQEVEEQTLKDKTLERSPEDALLDRNLSNERYKVLV